MSSLFPLSKFPTRLGFVQRSTGLPEHPVFGNRSSHLERDVVNVSAPRALYMHRTRRDDGRAAVGPALMHPVLLALTAACLFALGQHFARIALRYTDSQTAALFHIGTSALLFWLLSPLYLESHYWSSPVVLLFAAVGLFRPFISANLGMLGTRILGPTIASTMSATSPLFGLGLGFLVLAETLSVEVAIGALGISVGVAVLSWRGEARRQWPLYALLFPVGAAFLRALGHAIVKVGFAKLPDPFFAALVAHNVSLLLALLNNRRVRRRHQRVPRTALPWLILTGLVLGTAVLMLNHALLAGRLVVVAPILACVPLFSLLLGKALFREETLDRRVAIAVLIIVPSVALISARGG